LNLLQPCKTHSAHLQRGACSEAPSACMRRAP
jgi:hypothetical protein